MTVEKRLLNSVLEAFVLLFPRGNNYMYWLYWSQIVMFPIYTLFIVWALNLLDVGNTIQTDTFVAHMDFTTSHLVKPYVWYIISALMNYSWVLYQILIAHTFASMMFDGYRYIEEKANPKEIDEL